MSLLKESMTPYFTEDEIQKAVENLAKELEIDYHGRTLHLICPLKGSFIFLADLIRKMNLNLTVDFVYLKSIRKGETIEIKKDVESNLTDTHVLIVEEIIDEGKTLKFLRDHIAMSRPATLKILTLLDKPARRVIPIQADYVGLTIDDRYVVGYGLDSEEKGRNYPNLYSFKM